MEHLLLIVIGLVMGLFGGLIGIGGGIIMIPALVLIGGENQHLYQAACMICIFFVSAAAVIAHRKAKAIVPSVIKWLIPGALIGTVTGVAVSNSKLFQDENSYLLARVFGGFLLYVGVMSVVKLFRKSSDGGYDAAVPELKYDEGKAFGVGLLTGVCGGLLGIGGGSVATILQQLVLKIPIKRAMSNSAAMIVCASFAGAIYKNATLASHGISIIESLKIAACVIPTAFIGGYIGGHSMHILPKKVVRVVFIIVVLLSAIKMLTVQPSV